jgi:cytochrome c oxidase subunit 4
MADTTSNSAVAGEGAARHGDMGHVASPAVLIGTWGTLLILTGVTIAVARVDLGTWNVVVALAIASLKACLVALFFMHLKYDKKFNVVVFVTSLFFALVLVFFILFDTTRYQPDIREYEAAKAAEAAAAATALPASATATPGSAATTTASAIVAP